GRAKRTTGTMARIFIALCCTAGARSFFPIECSLENGSWPGGAGCGPGAAPQTILSFAVVRHPAHRLLRATMARRVQVGRGRKTTGKDRPGAGPPKPMVIDFHAHYPRQEDFIPRLLDAMCEAGIERTCLCSAGEMFGHVSNEEVREAFELHPDRIVGLAF